MSERITHECGVALVRLLKPLSYYQEKYGTPRPSEMSLPQAVQFTLRLLMIASEFDAATGGINPETDTYATIKILDSNAARTIDSAEQKRYLHQK